MKLVLFTVAANLASLASITFAGFLAMHEKAGWGWFLFVGAVCAGSIKYRDGGDASSKH